MEQEMPSAEAEFRKERGTRDSIATIHWALESTKNFKINVYVRTCSKDFNCVDRGTGWIILNEMGMLQHFIIFICNKMLLLRQDMRKQNGSHGQDV